MAGVSLFYEFFPAYSFHVGLFVFCSGYFYKDGTEKNIGNYIKKKLSSLILPLYLWNFTYALFAQVLSLRGGNLGVGVNLNMLFVAPITLGDQYVYNLGTWFIVPLFLVQIFNVLFRKMTSYIRNETKEYVCVISALLLGMCGVFCHVKAIYRLVSGTY